jgi:transposase
MGFANQCPVAGALPPWEKYSQQILALIREQRDLTLNEIVSILHRRRIPASRSALSRFFARHGITFKKKPAGGRAQASRRGSRAPTLDSRARLA